MLERVIGGFGMMERAIHRIAPQGFVVAFNVRNLTPEYYHTTFPDDWRDWYTKNTYVVFDPVMVWATLNVGRKRWSEITLLGMDATRSRVMKKAEDFDLKHGAIIVRRGKSGKGAKSFLSAARADREFDDDELDELETIFAQMFEDVATISGISEKELAVLDCLARGQTHEEAAQRLGVSKETIKRRLETSRRVLGAANGLQTVAIAVQRRLIDISGDQKW